MSDVSLSETQHMVVTYRESTTHAATSYNFGQQSKLANAAYGGRSLSKHHQHFGGHALFKQFLVPHSSHVVVMFSSNKFQCHTALIGGGS